MLAVSAAAVAAGARSVAAIAEWATDTPWPILAALGVRYDPLTRRCHIPGEATIRRVLARVDGDAVDAAVGACWPTGCARCVTAVCSRWTARGCGARPVTATRCTCWQRWTTMTAPCSPNAKSTARRVKCPPSSRYWPA